MQAAGIGVADFDPNPKLMKNHFNYHFRTNWSVVAFAILPLLGSPAWGLDLTWDADPVTAGAQGGAGTWTNGGTEWWDGGANVPWNNTTPDAAAFGGTAGGAVNLGTAITAAGLTFDTAGYALTGGTITLNGATVTTHQDATVSSQIVSNGLSKSGAATLVFDTAKTYTGNTTITHGVLELTGAGKLYNGGFNNSAVITINAGAIWRLPNYSYAGMGQLADYRQRRVLNGGTIEVTGASHSSGQDFTVNAAGGTFRYTPAGQTLTLSGNTNTNIQFNGPLTFDCGGNISVTGASAILEGTGSLSKTGPGTLTLAAANTFSGATTANEGTIAVTGSLRNTSGVTANAGATVQLGVTNMFVANHSTALGAGRVLTADGGTLVFTNLMDSRIGNITLRNGGTLTSNRGLAGWDVLLGNTTAGPATVAVSNTGGNTSPATMNGSGGIHLQGNQNFAIEDVTADPGADLTVSMILADGGSAGGSGGLTKTGPGTLRLAAPNTYTGTTAVNEGAVLLDGALQSATTVAPGAVLALSGTPAINAALTIQPGGLLDTTAAAGWSPLSGRALTAGRAGAPATDVSGNLTLAPGAMLQTGSGADTAATLTIDGDLVLDGGKAVFDLGDSPAGGANDTIALTGALDLASVSDLQFNLTDLALGHGSYPLVAAAGGVTGDPAALIPSGLPAGGGRQSFALSATTIPGTLTLDVTGTAATLIWTNHQGTGKWNFNDSNWDNAGASDKFVQGDTVRFEDTANATETIDLDTTVEASSITAANTAATTFVLGGAGKISGGTALHVTGGGTLRLANTGGNDFTGTATVANNSTLELADPAALPPDGQVLVNGATLDLGATGGVLAGHLTLQGAATLAGTTGTLDALSINAQGGLISADLVGSGAVTVATNATVGLEAATTLSTAIGIAAGGTLELRDGAAITGNLTNGGTLRGTATAGHSAQFTGVISGGGVLQQHGAGTLALGGAHTYSGATTIDAGTLDLATGDARIYADTYRTTTLTINPGGTLRAERINFGGANHLGQLTHNSPNSRLSGGTLELTGTGAPSGRGWTVSGASTIRTAAGSAHTWEPNNEPWIQIDLENGATLTFEVGGTFTLRSTLMDYTGIPGAAGGVSTSSGGIVKTGDGLLHLAPLTLAAAANTHRFTGATAVQQGTLILDANLGSSPVTVATAASLAVGGNIATLGCGGLTLAPGATLALDIDSATAAADRLNVTGNVDLGGATLALADLGAATLAGGTKFTLLTYTGTLANGFDGLADGATVSLGANEFTLAYHDASAVTLTVVAGGYADWAATHAPDGGPTGDFDGDGVPNAVEYILGGTKDANDLGKLPAATTQGANFVFTFTRAQASKTPDTTVRIEVGSDLATWPLSYDPASAPEISITDHGDGTETVTLTIPRAPDAKKFARLRVEIGS
jgi:fibronectin-binding autotransporter adhesin